MAYHETKNTSGNCNVQASTPKAGPSAGPHAKVTGVKRNEGTAGMEVPSASPKKPAGSANTAAKVSCAIFGTMCWFNLLE